MNAAPGGLAAPGVYDFREIESRWQEVWDNEHTWEVPNASNAEDAAQKTYYVLESPPDPSGDPSGDPRLGHLRSHSFADAIAHYHRLRGRRVSRRLLDDATELDWPARVERLRRDLLGRSARVEVICPCDKPGQARTLTKALANMGLAPISVGEPYLRVSALGIVTHDTDGDSKPIGPEPFLERYGAGTVRCYVLFMGPPDHDLDFSDGQLDGVHKFLGRLWRISTELGPAAPGYESPSAQPAGADLRLLRKTHETIAKVTETMEGDLRLHMAIAPIMGLVSESVSVRGEVPSATLGFALATAASLLFPFAPHCSSDVYHRLTEQRIWEVPWPTADPAFMTADELDIRVQVNGKLCDRVRVRRDVSRDELTRLARRSSHAQEHIQGHEISREVVVPGKLVNFVTRQPD